VRQKTSGVGFIQLIERVKPYEKQMVIVHDFL